MNKSIFIQELEEWAEGGRACLVKLNSYPFPESDSYYVVSSVDLALDTGSPETLVFKADSDGEITDWLEVAGGRNVSREEAIAELENLNLRGRDYPALLEQNRLLRNRAEDAEDLLKWEARTYQRNLEEIFSRYKGAELVLMEFGIWLSDFVHIGKDET